MVSLRWPWTVVALFGLGCSQVDYLELKPETVVLRQRNNEVWMQARAMSHTGVHHPRAGVSWSVEDPSVAEVDGTGKVKPLKSGRTELVASVGSVRATVPVEVRFAEKMVVQPTEIALREGGPSVELTVKVFDYEGRELADRTPTFRSLDKEVVSMGQNAAFPMNAGTAKVEVRVEELTEAVEVTVSPEGKGSSKKG